MFYVTKKKIQISLALFKTVLFFVFLAVLFAFFLLDFDKYLSLATLKENRYVLAEVVDKASVFSWSLYVSLYAFLTLFSVPGVFVLTIASGLLFGPVLGSTLTVLGATLGASSLFLVVRYVFRDFVKQKAGNSIQKLEKAFKKTPFIYLLFLRFLPIFPFWLVNVAPALLGMHFSLYVLGTLIGIIPGTFVFAMVGNSFAKVLEFEEVLDKKILFQPEIFLPLLGLSILILLPALYKRLKKEKL